MGYRIEYDDLGGKYEICRDKPQRFPVLMAGALAVFLLTVSVLWPEGAEEIRQWMIPGDDEVTVQAFHNMCQNLENGIPVGEAVRAFCRYVIHGA